MALCKDQRKTLVEKFRSLIKETPEDELANILTEAQRETPVPEDVRSTQLKRLVKLGYHKAAGMSKEEFANLIPEPEDKEGALLIIPATIVSVSKQMELIGGKNYLNLASLKDVVDTATIPYWIYQVEDGKEMLGKSPDTCIKVFKKQKRRGLIVTEGIAIAAQSPNTLEGHYIDLPGSRFGSARVPYLRLHNGRPWLRCYFSGDAFSGCGSASCGS